MPARAVEKDSSHGSAMATPSPRIKARRSAKVFDVVIEPSYVERALVLRLLQLLSPRKLPEKRGPVGIRSPRETSETTDKFAVTRKVVARVPELW